LHEDGLFTSEELTSFESEIVYHPKMIAFGDFPPRPYVGPKRSYSQVAQTASRQSSGVAINTRVEKRAPVMSAFCKPSVSQHMTSCNTSHDIQVTKHAAPVFFPDDFVVNMPTRLPKSIAVSNIFHALFEEDVEAENLEDNTETLEVSEHSYSKPLLINQTKMPRKKAKHGTCSQQNIVPNQHESLPDVDVQAAYIESDVLPDAVIEEPSVCQDPFTTGWIAHFSSNHLFDPMHIAIDDHYIMCRLSNVRAGQCCFSYASNNAHAHYQAIHQQHNDIIAQVDFYQAHVKVTCLLRHLVAFYGLYDEASWKNVNTF
jgi:hypothetical protein